jgi:hypothetical protein
MCPLTLQDFKADFSIIADIAMIDRRDESNFRWFKRISVGVKFDG